MIEDRGEKGDWRAGRQEARGKRVERRRRRKEAERETRPKGTPSGEVKD